MKSKKYDKEKLTQIIKDSISIAQVLKRLEIVVAGGNYQTIKAKILEWDIDISHFTGKGHENKQYVKTENLNKILLNEKRYINTFSLKNRLLKAKIKEHKCENCKLTTWLTKNIPLELHHVDGNRNNNLIENIQLLCPNCHALTDNYRGKNKKKPIEILHEQDIIKKDIIPKFKLISCKQCKKEFEKIFNKQIFCSQECTKLFSRKVERPTKEQLLKEIEESSYVAVGKKYGVSDNAIRKWLK